MEKQFKTIQQLKEEYYNFIDYRTILSWTEDGKNKFRELHIAHKRMFNWPSFLEHYELALDEDYEISDLFFIMRAKNISVEDLDRFFIPLSDMEILYFDL